MGNGIEEAGNFLKGWLSFTLFRLYFWTWQFLIFYRIPTKLLTGREPSRNIWDVLPTVDRLVKFGTSLAGFELEYFLHTKSGNSESMEFLKILNLISVLCPENPHLDPMPGGDRIWSKLRIFLLKIGRFPGFGRSARNNRLKLWNKIG